MHALNLCMALKTKHLISNFKPRKEKVLPKTNQEIELKQKLNLHKKTSTA